MKFQSLFLYRGDLYIKNKNTLSDMFCVQATAKKEGVKKLKDRIESELGVEAEYLFKLACEPKYEVATYVFEINKVDDNYCKIDENMLKSAAKYQQVYSLQALLELRERDIDVFRLDEILSSQIVEDIRKAYTSYFKTVDKQVKKEKIDRKDQSRFVPTLIISMILGFIFQYMFIERSLGVSVTIYSLVFLAGAIYLAKDKIKYKNMKFLFLICVAGVIAILFSIYHNEVFMFFNCIILIVTINAAILVGEHDMEFDEKLFLMATAKIIMPVENIGRVFRMFFRIKKEKKNVGSPRNSEQKKYVLQGLGVLAVILIFIVPLLMSADGVFQMKIMNFSEIFDVDIDDMVFIRTIIFTFMFIYNVNYLWSIQYNFIIEEAKKPKVRFLKFDMLWIVFGGINIVYLLFTYIQFSYLYGGSEGALPYDMNYSTYAREGFFQLVAVTVINIFMIVYAKSRMEKRSVKNAKIMNSLYTVMIALTYNMLVSAFYRMVLYIEEYRLTRLRVMVQISILAIGLFMFVILIWLWREKTSMKQIIIVSGLIIYIGSNIFNIDGYIVRENIKVYNSTGKCDIEYISQLGYDGLSVLKEMVDNDEIHYNNDADYWKFYKALRRKRGYGLKRKDKDIKWFEFNLNKYKTWSGKDEK